MTTSLELEDVHTYYGNIHALKGVSLTVDEGEIVTLIGSNGAGKIDHAAHDQRHRARRARARSELDGQEIHTMPAHEIVTHGHRPVARGPARVRADDRRTRTC